MTDLSWKVDTDKNVYVDDFISGYCEKISHMYQKDPFMAFCLIGIGIEFLGKCLDETVEFNQYIRSLPKNHFNNAISSLFPANYVSIDIDLQDSLRNGFAHALTPKSNIWLRETNNTQYAHLSKHEIQGVPRLVLIYEEFYDDFEKACHHVIEKIHNNELIHAKIKRPIIVINEE